jgi:DNA-binding GntR family transcriptional regulator
MLHASGNYSTANEQHQAMFGALRDSDSASIKKAVQADIDAAYRVLMGLLN